MKQSFNKEEIWGKQAQEKCSASLVISEMQMKVIKRCHYTPIRMPKTNKTRAALIVGKAAKKRNPGHQHLHHSHITDWSEERYSHSG